MELTEKDRLIRKVLERRMDVVEKVQGMNLSPVDRAYYEGKAEGYLQAHALLGESEECIAVELDEEQHK